MFDDKSINNQSIYYSFHKNLYLPALLHQKGKNLIQWKRKKITLSCKIQYRWIISVLLLFGVMLSTRENHQQQLTGITIIYKSTYENANSI